LSSFSTHFVKRVVKRIFPTLRKTHLVNVSYGVFGQIKSQSGKISEIVREVPGAQKHRHRFKRFFRFLSNPRFKPEILRDYWVSWCVKTFCSDSVVKVAMDWTTLPGNIQCLMLAIPVGGRAIPLLWQCIKYCDIKDSQNMIEERLVARLVNLVKETVPEKKLLLTADRGFGRAAFIEFLLKKEVLFAIRVKSDVHIKPVSGKVILLRDFGKQLVENVPVWFEGISYRSDGKVTGVHLACVVAKPEKGKEADPWFLVTNLKDKEITIARYHERFHIEEWFKDLKHRLGIANIQTKNIMRIRRILFLAACSYGLLMVIGTVAKPLDDLRDSLITGGKHVASEIWFAIKIIKHELLGRSFFANVYERVLGP